MKSMLKKIKSGRLLEVDYYPAWDNGKRIPARMPKKKRSTEEQARYNYRQTVKKVIRLVNANFDSTDILMHPTYIQEQAPESEEQARRDIHGCSFTRPPRTMNSKRGSTQSRMCWMTIPPETCTMRSTSSRVLSSLNPIRLEIRYFRRMRERIS